jgi:hypothetical protein
VADNLYDTGAPKRIIVEHRVTVHHVSHGARNDMTEPPESRVTITPEFQPVAEPKQIAAPSYRVCPKCSAMYDREIKICLSCKPDTLLRPATSKEIEDFEKYA